MTFFKTSKVAGNLSRIVFALGLLATAQFGFAQDSASAAPEPVATVSAPVADSALIARVADLEAYINNVAPANLTGVPGPGHNGFMMICTALVLFMTLPGLALFYGGLVRSKNILSVIAQCMGLSGLVAILWWAVGYSFAFDAGSPFLGGLHKAFLAGVTSAPNTTYAAWVSENVFSMYQLMFAIITPALIVGAIAERMKFSAVLLFLTAWMFVVYFPLAHMVWGGDGFMNGVWNASAGIKAIDFAGGTVVHMSSGWSALVLCIILGKRVGFGTKNFAPHSLVLTAIGTGMLWVGWYGFNAGSAVAADGVASQAFATTTLAAAIAGFIWAVIDWVLHGKPTILGFCSGIVAGLVVITPAAGFVTLNGAVIIGIAAAIVPYFAVAYLKKWLGYDDALDTFGVHGVGGTLGALLTGFLATPAANANLSLNLSEVVGKTLWIEQLKAIGVTLVISIVGTIVLAYLVKLVIGLRPTKDEELEGLDTTDHGEAGYHYEEG
jgi:Amt family ammonium transporter